MALGKFAIVGAIGFFVDVSVLYIALFIGFDPYSGRLLSFLVAATFTWICNRNWTFSDRARGNRFSQWLKYLAANSIGAAVNLSVYGIIMWWLPASGIWPAFATGLGSIAGLAFNYTSSHHLVFKTKN